MILKNFREDFNIDVKKKLALREVTTLDQTYTPIQNYELVTKHQLARHRKTCNSLSNLQVKLQWKAHFSLEPNLAIRVASEPLKSPTVIMRLFYEPSYNPIANPIADPALLNPLLTSNILMVFWMSTLFPLGMKEFNST